MSPARATKLVDTIGAQLPDGFGFILLIAPLGGDQPVQCISNVDERDRIATYRNILNEVDGKKP